MNQELETKIKKLHGQIVAMNQELGSLREGMKHWQETSILFADERNELIIELDAAEERVRKMRNQNETMHQEAIECLQRAETAERKLDEAELRNDFAKCQAEQLAEEYDETQKAYEYWQMRAGEWAMECDAAREQAQVLAEYVGWNCDLISMSVDMGNEKRIAAQEIAHKILFLGAESTQCPPLQCDSETRKKWIAQTMDKESVTPEHSDCDIPGCVHTMPTGIVDASGRPAVLVQSNEPSSCEKNPDIGQEKPESALELRERLGFSLLTPEQQEVNLEKLKETLVEQLGRLLQDAGLRPYMHKLGCNMKDCDCKKKVWSQKNEHDGCRNYWCDCDSCAGAMRAERKRWRDITFEQAIAIVAYTCWKLEISKEFTHQLVEPLHAAKKGW